MCDSGVQVVNGLLHGFHPEAQRVILSLEQGVLLVQVAVTLRTVLTRHALPLHAERVHVSDRRHGGFEGGDLSNPGGFRGTLL